MKNLKLSTLFWVISIVLIAFSISACNRRRPNSGGNKNPTSKITPNINILNSTTSNNIYNQQSYDYITVQNIDKSRIEYISKTVNNLTNNTEYVTINNMSASLSVDNSINQNYISQQLIQKIYKPKVSGNDERSPRGRQRQNSQRSNSGSSGQNNLYSFHEGDRVEINNININGVAIGGIIAIVDNDQTKKTNIVISENTYQQIKQQISEAYANVNYAPKEYRSTEQGRTPQNNIPEPFRGTDPGGVNFLTIIGAIVVILFILWIVSWFVKI